MNSPELAPPQTYQIPEVKLTTLKKSLDAMIRKASKLGVEACGYTVGQATDIPYATVFSSRFEGNADGLKRAELSGAITYRRFVEVTISGPNPVLAGWEFVATLQHLTDDKGLPVNTLRTSPSFKGKLPEQFRNVLSTNCDHCHVRRVRNDTYVVRNVATGEWKQIGSTCIKDFCGGLDPRAVASILAWWLDTDRDCQSDEESDGCGRAGGNRWSLRYFLAVTAACVRENGWMSRAKAQEQGREATADTVTSCLRDPAKCLVDKRTDPS